MHFSFFVSHTCIFFSDCFFYYLFTTSVSTMRRQNIWRRSVFLSKKYSEIMKEQPLSNWIAFSTFISYYAALIDPLSKVIFDFNTTRN